MADEVFAGPLPGRQMTRFIDLSSAGLWTVGLCAGRFLRAIVSADLPEMVALRDGLNYSGVNASGGTAPPRKVSW